MRLIYVDESYCEECYYVGALLVPHTEAPGLSKDLDRVANQARTSFPALPLRPELHGHDIFQGKGDWAPIKEMLRARIGVYTQAFQAIADHNASIIMRGVFIPSLLARYGDRAHPPHDVALSHLLERCDEYLESIDDLGLVIADEPGQVEEQPKYRDALRTYQRIGTPGYRARQLTRILDTIYYAPSSASRLMQAADLVAFLYHRIQAVKRPDPRARRENAKLWALVEHCVVHHFCWFP